MRKRIYHLAVSLNGYIAREDGSAEGFLTQGPHVTEYLKAVQPYDTVGMGRVPCEAGYVYGFN